MNPYQQQPRHRTLATAVATLMHYRIAAQSIGYTEVEGPDDLRLVFSTPIRPKDAIQIAGRLPSWGERRELPSVPRLNPSIVLHQASSPEYAVREIERSLFPSYRRELSLLRTERERHQRALQAQAGITQALVSAGATPSQRGFLEVPLKPGPDVRPIVRIEVPAFDCQLVHFQIRNLTTEQALAVVHALTALDAICD